MYSSHLKLELLLAMIDIPKAKEVLTAASFVAATEDLLSLIGLRHYSRITPQLRCWTVALTIHWFSGCIYFQHFEQHPTEVEAAKFQAEGIALYKCIKKETWYILWKIPVGWWVAELLGRCQWNAVRRSAWNGFIRAWTGCVVWETLRLMKLSKRWCRLGV